MSDLEGLTQELEANYAAIEKAFQDKDIDGIARFLAPDFAVHQKDGTTVSRDQALAGMKLQMQTMEDMSWHRRVTKLERDGDVATATVEGTLRATLKTPDGRPVPIDMEIVATDVWVQTAKGWLTRSARTEVQVHAERLTAAAP